MRRGAYIVQLWEFYYIENGTGKEIITATKEYRMPSRSKEWKRLVRMLTNNTENKTGPVGYRAIKQTE